jgi:hypothetical protein
MNPREAVNECLWFAAMSIHYFFKINELRQKTS